MQDDLTRQPENNVVTLPDYETPEQLKAEALELGSPMTYQAAEYIERYHRLYAKALVEITALREVAEAARPVIKDYDRWRAKKRKKMDFMEDLRNALKGVV